LLDTWVGYGEVMDGTGPGPGRQSWELTEAAEAANV
jgi:hypothetical protein